MATPKAWIATSYTNGAQTSLVAESAVLASIIIANNSVENVVVSLQHGSAIILPATTIEAGTPYPADLRSLVVSAATPLTFICDAAGVHFSVSGATYAS